MGQAELGTPEATSAPLILQTQEFPSQCKVQRFIPAVAGSPGSPIQKYSGDTALFMEQCMPYLRYFLLFIPFI